MRCVDQVTLGALVYALLALCVSCSGITDRSGSRSALHGRSGISKRASLSAPIQTTLNLYAAYAGAAYNDMDEWTCTPECQDPGTSGTVIDYTWDIGVVTSNGYVAHNPNKRIIVVAFRGTNEPGDWLQDLTLTHYPWPSQIAGSSVISGFLSGYLVARPLVIQNVLDLATRFPGYSIVATGHSLGASRAAMFVADFALQHPELRQRLQMYTYGQAKCGNKSFADFMNGSGIPITRVVNKGDIAPHLPGDDPTLVQFGTEVWYTPTNDTVTCTNEDYSKCSEGLPQTALNIADHSTYPNL
ncbi:hypothetical protein IW140_000736 [Coemansia sp. RSA 1813]|nr:hypothetical protein EV178_000758 [Coemansia sp. RSA 1646]KAJ1773605.1 hypothetical protein LPJ74_000521 [Coemansia sp. RSA 1843]KAJ2217395.1 hypothetical protein EV179_000545 [Coemansia sp. RSA 487]KAJ2572621.1 hypothetical protein IW140_000736 [Coemansia sp. RSA 1813]